MVGLDLRISDDIFKRFKQHKAEFDVFITNSNYIQTALDVVLRNKAFKEKFTKELNKRYVE